MRISDWSSDVCSSDLQTTAAKIDDGAGSVTKPGIHQRAAHFECAARRVSDEVGVRLGKERGEDDAARKHDGNAVVHVARHASLQSPPGGGSLTSIPRPPAARCGSALAMPLAAAVPCCASMVMERICSGICKLGRASCREKGCQSV